MKQSMISMKGKNENYITYKTSREKFLVCSGDSGVFAE